MFRTGLVLLVISAALTAAFPFSKTSGVVELTPKTFDAFLNTHKPVFIMFYAPWCGHCKSLHPDYEKFGKAVKDVVRIGAVNADQYRELGSRFGISGFPTIKYWKMGSKNGQQPNDYSGQRSYGALHNAAVREIVTTNVLTAVSRDTVVKAVDKATEHKAVILFSAKTKSPPIFSVLSMSPHFKDKLGFVLATEAAKGVAAEFSAGSTDKLPRIVVVSRNADGGFDTQGYDGALEYTPIAQYLLKVLGVNDTASTASGEEGEAKKEAPKARAPPRREPRPAAPVRPVELTMENFKTFCSFGAPKVRGQQPFCVISMTQDLVDFNDVHGHFANEAVHFFWIPESARRTWMQDIQDGLQPRHNRLSPDDIVILRAAKDRTKFAVWRHDPSHDHGHVDAFKIFLAKCLGGELTFEKNPHFPVLRQPTA